MESVAYLLLERFFRLCIVYLSVSELFNKLECRLELDSSTIIFLMNYICFLELLL